MIAKCSFGVKMIPDGNTGVNQKQKKENFPAFESFSWRILRFPTIQAQPTHNYLEITTFGYIFVQFFITQHAKLQ